MLLIMIPKFDLMKYWLILLSFKPYVNIIFVQTESNVGY